MRSSFLASIDIIASIVWNSITSSDASRLECIQQRYVAMSFNSFFPQVHYCCSFALEELNNNNNNNKLRGFSPQANYTDRAIAAGQRS
jgi:hypothetical protein